MCRHLGYKPSWKPDAMISLNDIVLMRGTNTLLEGTSLVLHSGQRTGVIGRNGSGKTSLFAALEGNLPLEQGDICFSESMRFSTMEQETVGSDRSALNHVIDADKQFRQLEQRLSEAESRQDHTATAVIHNHLDAIGAYDIQNRAEQLLSGLGFGTDEFDNHVSSFSGGWRVRLNLAAALMCPSDLLMLDEPTNHLDLEATIWLEQWLLRYPGTLLIISHDRSFLDKVIDHVISFEHLDLKLYKGNYSSYEKQRAERMALQQAMFEKQQRRRTEIEDFVRRFRYKESKAKQAQSRLKELNRMQDIAPAHIDSPFRFQFPAVDKLPSFLLSVEKLSIGFDFPLTSNMSFLVRSATRMGLLGRNGSGKSTLLKVLAGKLEPLAGTLNKTKHLRIGYFAQHQIDELDQTGTPLSVLLAVNRKAKEQDIRNYLGGFYFVGKRVDEVISNFSGGEKARLALAKIAWEKPNILLLDEPTNHLDLDMRHALTVALQGFEGAIIMVSHDRHLLANTAEEFYLIHHGEFAEFEGDLDDYESWIRSYEKDSVSSPTGTENNLVENGRADKKEQRQLAAAKRVNMAPLRKREKQLEKSIEVLHNELQVIEESLADPLLYDDDNKSKLKDTLFQQGKLKTQLRGSEEEWLQVQEKIEAF
jgi:ATP-binding cassette subfamily F protein 3